MPRKFKNLNEKRRKAGRPTVYDLQSVQSLLLLLLLLLLYTSLFIRKKILRVKNKSGMAIVLDIRCKRNRIKILKRWIVTEMR